MFQKPFRIKSNSAVKSSVRKQLKRALTIQYPSLPVEAVDEVFPSKGLLQCVRYESGKDGSVSTYYVLENSPFLFLNNKVLYPTVYTLWKNPEMIRSVTTSVFVVKKLLEGADLMLPGVLTEDSGGFGLKGITAGQPLAVNITGNRSAVAVGVSLMSYDQMIANQMRGKVVEILHVCRDHLWHAGSKQEPPVIPYTIDSSTPSLVIEDGPDVTVPNLSELSIDDTECAERALFSTEILDECSDEVKMKVSEEVCEPCVVDQQDTPCIQGGRGAVEYSDEDDPEPDVDMDALLLECFLKAIKSLVKPKDLPLLTSTLYGSFMMQTCPSDLRLDIKKSSFKKVSKFLGSLVAQGVMEINSEGGTDTVTTINFDHELVHSFRPVLIKGAQKKPSESATTTCQGITVEEVWSPGPSLAPLFTPHGVRKGTTVTASHVRSIITQYVKSNGLVSQHNAQMVVVDPILSDGLKLKADMTSLPWKQLFSMVFEKMKPSFIIHSGSTETVVKHTLPKVKLTVCRRANKTVTLVDNLEVYGIPPADLAHRMQKLAACHTAVQVAAGGHGSQVLIQGNHVKATVKTLEDVFGLPAKLMEAQDNIKPLKKKGNKK